MSDDKFIYRDPKVSIDGKPFEVSRFELGCDFQTSDFGLLVPDREPQAKPDPLSFYDELVRLIETNPSAPDPDPGADIAIVQDGKVYFGDFKVTREIRSPIMEGSDPYAMDFDADSFRQSFRATMPISYTSYASYSGFDEDRYVAMAAPPLVEWSREFVGYS